MNEDNLSGKSQHSGKYINSFSCGRLGKKIDTAVMFMR